MADDTSQLAQGIKLIQRMELILPPDQFLSWLLERPGADVIYSTFVAHHIEEPTELVITESTTLAEAFPLLAKQAKQAQAFALNYRPTNGDGRWPYTSV